MEYTACEDIHSHECGAYALEQLQEGRTPTEVVALLREKYLVSTTQRRVMAYRYYREQRSEYWTVEKLEQNHWSFLYEKVDLVSLTARDWGLARSPVKRMKVGAIRTELCGVLRISEELLPLSVF